MAKEEPIKQTGTVTKRNANSIFNVILDNGHEIICHLSGNIRQNSIKIMEGDTVDVEMSAYDLSKGRIIYRQKTPGNNNQGNFVKNTKKKTFKP